jgi:Ala-tRNA(Pro) deacylase
MNIESFLRNRGIDFDVLPHNKEYTASHTAQALHVPGGHFAKTVVLKADDRPVMTVVPANRLVNIELVRQELGAADVHLADEDEFAQLFPDCELGAIPPFGSVYQMETIVDDALTHDQQFVFEGNSHDRAISMLYQDYGRIEHPHVAQITN